MGERIEIPSADLLRSDRALADELRDVAQRTGMPLGWHYLLDLIWAARELDPKPGMRVLDAGAGTGVMQWWLAERGVDVLSVDRESRRDLPLRLRAMYPVRSLRPEDLAPLPRPNLRQTLGRYWYALTGRPTPSPGPPPPAPRAGARLGTVTISQQDLLSMPLVGDASVDAVVAISALEHNHPDELERCVAELLRVIRPGGRLIATLTAARAEDWFHEPSRGWCYSEPSLRRAFDLPRCPSNYDRYDELLEVLRGSEELRSGLAQFYFESGENGMPWGVWDPKYQPVGVVKVKGDA
jgi:ubiquinone/menaquinone biosynthesis C-methylase UbiE